MTALVRTSGAAFGYGRKPVLSQVDLEVAPGDLIGIVGPNGSGKTTLFRGLLGLLPPLAGRVELNTGAVGYVPQRETLDPIYPLTVEEVVHMGCYARLVGALRRVSDADRALADECVARVGLSERRRELFASLSGGQRQRALLARALMTRPRLLLLDEPTSGVDRGAEEEILDLLRELGKEGLAVLLVSHQLGLVREAVHEALWVCGGRVTRGPAEEILTPEALDELYFRGRSHG
jgi:ABC-type Mn2+/Zn2+ transport system ATPase subunit